MDKITKLFYDHFSPAGRVVEVQYKEDFSRRIATIDSSIEVISHEITMCIEPSDKSLETFTTIKPFMLADLQWRLVGMQTSLESSLHLTRGILTLYVDFKA